MNAQSHSGAKKGRPFVVFAGRSNVGKSSTIRALTGKKVVIGKHPGSTRWEKMFDIDTITIVDIPGFGFMKGKSKTTIEEMKVTIVQKLEGWSDQITLAVLVLDISLFRELAERWEKRNEIPIDIEFYTFLSEISPDVIVVANKIDKLNKREQISETDFLRERLIGALPSREPIIVEMSASKRIGIDLLKKKIEESLIKRDITIPNW